MKTKVLTKVKTRVSTRTILLIALGLIIVGGAAFGLAPFLNYGGSAYDLNNDGIVSQEDVNMASARYNSICNWIANIPTCPKSITNYINANKNAIRGGQNMVLPIPQITCDANGDGVLNDKDTDLFNNIYLNRSQPIDTITNTTIIKYLDIGNRGKVNLADMQLCSNKYRTKCIDTDSGANYDVKGNVNIPGYGDDYCIDGKTLMEQTCMKDIQGNTLNSGQTTAYNCTKENKVCNNGACVSSPKK